MKSQEIKKQLGIYSPFFNIAPRAKSLEDVSVKCEFVAPVINCGANCSQYTLKTRFGYSVLDYLEKNECVIYFVNGCYIFGSPGSLTLGKEVMFVNNDKYNQTYLTGIVEKVITTKREYQDHLRERGYQVTPPKAFTKPEGFISGGLSVFSLKGLIDVQSKLDSLKPVIDSKPVEVEKKTKPTPEPTSTPLPETLQEALKAVTEDEVLNLEKAKLVLNKVRTLLTEQGFKIKKGFMAESYFTKDDSMFLQVEMEGSLESWVFGFEPKEMLTKGATGTHIIFNPWNTHDVDSGKAIKLTETLLQLAPGTHICSNDDGSWDFNSDSPTNFLQDRQTSAWRELFEKDDDEKPDFHSLTGKQRDEVISSVLKEEFSEPLTAKPAEVKKMLVYTYTNLIYDDVYDSVVRVKSKLQTK